MIAAFAPIKPLVDEFLAVLDEEIGLEQAALEHLASFSTAIIARDEPEMRRLLAESDAAQDRFACVEQRRQVIRDRLAAALGWRPQEITLTRLAARLPEPEAQAVEDRKRRLQGLADGVRRRHMQTAMLLVECARINRTLLLGLFPELGTVRTYGAAGLTPWRPGAGLLDTRS